MTNLEKLSLLDLLTLASMKGQAGKDHFFDDRNKTGQDRSNDSWIEEKVLEGVNKSLPLSKDQVQEAIKLVRTGKVGDDLSSSLKETLTTVSDIPTGLLSNPFSILASPLQTIALPITSARNAAKIFIDPKNRTFRLAILAYARMNGINITESNVNDVYNLLDNPSSENLEELAKGGLETIKEEYGLNDLNDALQKFKSLTNQ